MIDWTLYAAFVGFALTAGFTPGPNNFMLMSSGALFGLRRTTPHILGVGFGFPVVMLAAMFGMGVVIDQFPWLLTVVKIAGATWLAWLGLKFFKAALLHKGYAREPLDKSEKQTRSRPFRFYEAVLFQWVNPKGLIMALATASAYVDITANFQLRTLLICGTFFLVSLASASTWAVAGSTLNRLMSQGRAAVVLNVIMGLLLLATAAMILMTHS